jgi:hypothetical protein
MSMDATLRDKAAEFAKEFSRNISTPQELSEIMRLMSKSMIERMPQDEMEVHLRAEDAAGNAQGMATATAKDRTAETAAETSPRGSPGGKPAGRNRRNGTSTKTVQGEPGQMTIETPRDRNGRK